MGSDIMFDMAIGLGGIRTPVHIERLCRDDYLTRLPDQPRCFVVVRVEGMAAHTTIHDNTKSPNVMIIEYDNGGKITIKGSGLTNWHWQERGAIRIDDGQN